MLFFLNLDGTMKRADSERVFQGSTAVPDVKVITPLSSDSGVLQISFTLPNGLVTQYQPLVITGHYQNADGFTLHVWSISAENFVGNVTEQLGEVGVSVRYVNIHTQAVTASYTCEFTVEYSALPAPPTEYTQDDFQDLFNLLNAYYLQNAVVLQQNRELIESIGGDYGELVRRLNAAEQDIDNLEAKTANPLLGDFTIDLETGEGTKYYKDGTTENFQVYTGDVTVIQRNNFLKVITFTDTGWTQESDGTYSRAFAPSQTERTNSQCLIAVDVKDGTGYSQTANGVFKGSDGSVLLFGSSEPYAGRICILAGSGSGTQIYNGVALSHASGTASTADSNLAANAFVGDYYINTTHGYLYVCTSRTSTTTSWEYLMKLKPNLIVNGTQTDTATIYAPGGGGAQGYILFASGANQPPVWGSFTINGANVANKGFYAPTSSGSSGNILQSGGANNAPSWYTWQVNGSSAAGNKSWYAPIGAGTSGYICVSSGSGAPTWKQLTFKTSNGGLTVTLALGGTAIGSFTVAQEVYLDSVTYNDTTHKLTFVFNIASGKQNVEVDLSDLIDTYTAGDGLQLSSGAFSIKLKTGEANLVVDSNGLSLDTTNLLAKNGTATLLANGWTLSGSVYTQSVTVSSVGANDTLLVAGASASDCIEMQTANVFYATASGTTVTFSAKQEPTADINIEYTIVRGQA